MVQGHEGETGTLRAQSLDFFFLFLLSMTLPGGWVVRKDV